jgi:antitoxin component YwqK of YwqJK toxin-antitoxin module
MIRVILATILIASFGTTYSQKIAITYYDSAWLLTTKNFAKYYRTGIIDTIKYQYFGEVKDYYINGKLQMKGKFQANIKVDTFYFYYPSGKLMTKGPYRNNNRYGIWTNYYENGRIKDKVLFNKDFIAALEYYDENGIAKMVHGTGEWETEYYFDLVREVFHVKGLYKDSLRHGTWKSYRRSLIPAISHEQKLEYIEEYDNGRFVRGKYYWAGGGNQDIGQPTMIILPEIQKFEKLGKWSTSKYASIDAYPYLKFLPKVDSSVFPVDKKAEFPGGLDSLKKYFSKNVKLSKSYVDSHKSIASMFNVMIDETGKLEITQDPNKTLLVGVTVNQYFYEQVLKTIKKLPIWKPAKRGNKSVKNYFWLVVHLNDGNIRIELTSRN